MKRLRRPCRYSLTSSRRNQTQSSVEIPKRKEGRRKNVKNVFRVLGFLSMLFIYHSHPQNSSCMYALVLMLTNTFRLSLSLAIDNVFHVHGFLSRRRLATSLCPQQLIYPTRIFIDSQKPLPSQHMGFPQHTHSLCVISTLLIIQFEQQRKHRVTMCLLRGSLMMAHN